MVISEPIQYTSSKMQHHGRPRLAGRKGRNKMYLRTTAIALGVAAALGIGAASAQPAPQSGAHDGGAQGYSQQGSGDQSYHKHRHKHGIAALLKEEMSAGRLSQKEGTLLLEKIKQMHAEKRAERDARYHGQGMGSQGQSPR
jgi:hypothetical protein